LLIDDDGFLCEGTGANVFLVKDDIVYTPEGRNCLRGISRDYVMTRWPCREKNLDLYDLLTADEAFFTGTPFCILPITACNGQLIGEGTPGDITQTLLRIWSDNVGVDIVQQIKAWDATAEDRVIERTSPYALRA
jgi:branched-chain amino acid aminotransferase